MKIRAIFVGTVLLSLGLLGAQEADQGVLTNDVTRVENPPRPALPEEVAPSVVPIPVKPAPPETKTEESLPPPPKTETPPVKAAPVTPPAPKVGLQSVPIAGGVEYYVGARYFEKKSGGWGWIKKPDEGWKKARWVAIKETPHKYHLPHRGLGNAEADHQFQYKLLGSFADYQIYDPHRDELMDVFVIQGYESLGLQKSIERKPGPPGRFASKKSGAYTRRNSVQVDDDSF